MIYGNKFYGYGINTIIDFLESAIHDIDFIDSIFIETENIKESKISDIFF